MTFTMINGQPARIMRCQYDPSLRTSGAGNIIVKNLDKSIDSNALKGIFFRFGKILSCKVSDRPILSLLCIHM